VFQHPIPFGVFTGGVLALCHLVLGSGQSGLARWWRSAIIFFTACLSLSSWPRSNTSSSGRADGLGQAY
jgi:hypothetical protein